MPENQPAQKSLALKGDIDRLAITPKLAIGPTKLPNLAGLSAVLLYFE